MNNILIMNDDNSMIIHLSDFQDNIDYVQFELQLTTSVFRVSTIAYAQIEEISELTENLKRMLKREINTFYFSPLSEHWSINFILKENCVNIKGSVSDLERLQSHLDFYGNLNINDLSAVVKQLE